MKKYILIISFFAIFSFTYQITNAQCKQYIQAIAPMQLEPFVIDGNFLSPVIYEGDQISLTRTFLVGQKYKVIVVGMDIFEKKITITDQDGFILFKNYSSKITESPRYFTDENGDKIVNFGSNYWVFEPTVSQNLTITIEIEQKAKSKKKRIQGCMGVVVGFLPLE